jgi:hypothetical protein
VSSLARAVFGAALRGGACHLVCAEDWGESYTACEKPLEHVAICTRIRRGSTAALCVTHPTVHIEIELALVPMRWLSDPADSCWASS